MRIQSLGHVVIRVSDLARAEAFYHGLLGLPISTRAPEWEMVFFTLGSHHDFAISATGDAKDEGRGPGLDHVAFRLGRTEDLREAKLKLEQAGVTVAPIDHVVTHSIYFQDPDGNGVELYVDTAADWRSDPKLILSESRRLEL